MNLNNFIGINHFSDLFSDISLIFPNREIGNDIGRFNICSTDLANFSSELIKLRKKLEENFLGFKKVSFAFINLIEFAGCKLTSESIYCRSWFLDKYFHIIKAGCIAEGVVINIDVIFKETIIRPLINQRPFLRVLHFEDCEFDQSNDLFDRLDWIPDQIEFLHLEKCLLPKNEAMGKFFGFSLKKIIKIKNVILDNCENKIIVEFPLEQNHQIESLRILNHNPRLSDNTFKGFPKSLKEFEISSANITDKTIEKLGAGIRSLKLEDCPKITMSPERASLFFAEGTFQGLKKETSETDKFRKILKKAVIGQPQAINVAFEALCVSLSGLTPNNRPAGVFLFAGPSGVGKTELAKAIALAGKRHLLQYDMSEYQLEHEVSKLLGAPPGYLGYYEPSKLPSDVETYPNAVILFDEIEKAHPTVHKVLLGVFDSGRMTDNKGITTSFAQTIIIMTSNLGASSLATLDWSNTALALKESENIVLQLLIQKTAPEFAGRIDKIVPFRPLEENTIRNIMRSKVKRYEEEMNLQHKLQLTILESAWESLLTNLDPALGARPIIRRFEQEVNAELGKALLNKYIKKDDKLEVFRKEGKIKLQFART